MLRPNDAVTAKATMDIATAKMIQNKASKDPELIPKSRALYAVNNHSILSIIASGGRREASV